jgi:hypothetical protein
MIHNTFLVYGRKILASSQYWPTTVTPDEIDEFITTRADLLAEHGGSMDLPLIIGDKKFLARTVESDMLLIFVTDKGEDEHVVAERLDTAAKELAKKVRANGIRGIAKQYATLIEPMITTRLKIALVGEGGVGKTTFVVNLAVALALKRKKVAIFDADLGLANVHILMGVKPQFNLSHLIQDGFALEDVIHRPDDPLLGRNRQQTRPQEPDENRNDANVTTRLRVLYPPRALPHASMGR